MRCLFYLNFYFYFKFVFDIYCYFYQDWIVFDYILIMVCDDVNFGLLYNFKICFFKYQFYFLSIELKFECVLFFKESIYESKFIRY